MVKKMLTLVVAAASALGIYAQQAAPAQQQQPQLQQLQLDPNIRTGVLPNGLTYYVMHNEEPKQRANFYIAQKVGSALENSEQLGLAHFLEHMAFNGTTHYPGKSMLEYLQGKGIRFGADINAYTYYDETVYNINNVPTTDKALMDSVLLCLQDWSCGILLEEDEIDAERGVIEGEWRQRNDANFRMSESVYPKIFQEFPYQQMVIGKLDIIRKFPYSVIRDYYKKWYRPDQQGIVVIGDFDAAEMEKKVVEMFSKIPMPANAAPRTYQTVSDNKEPIYAYFEDSEMPNGLVTISFKTDAPPFEIRNTAPYYIQSTIAESLFSSMINTRLSEAMRKADCPYAYAGVSFGNYRMAITKDAFNIYIVPKTDVEASVRAAMGIVAQACKTGFLPGELQRAKDEMLASYQKMFNERNKTDNDRIASGIIRHFLENEAHPGIAKEYEIMQQILPVLPVQAFNMLGAQLLTDENQVMVVARTKVDGQAPLAQEQMIAAMQEPIKAEYEPYVDEEITEPLLSSVPTAGSIKSTASNAEFGTTEFTLSNGVKVVVKPTTFAEDEILFTATRRGGTRTYKPEDAPNLDFISYAVDCSKLGNFKQSILEKYLAGKNLSLSFIVGGSTDLFSGKSTVKDFPTFMEVLYATIMQLTPDTEEWASIKSQLEVSLQSQEKNPQAIFIARNTKNQYGNNPLKNRANLASLEQADYQKMIDMFHAATANMADYTFYFTGNVNIDELKPLLEKYVASLPTAAKTERKNISSIDYVTGIHEDVFTQPMEAPSTLVFNTFVGANLPYDAANTVRLELVSDILDMMYIRSLREEIGGTYGASVRASVNPYTGQWDLYYIFNSEPDKQDVMIARAYSDLMDLLNKGANKDDFNRVKEAALKQLEINEAKNSFWNANLPVIDYGYNAISGRKQAIEKVTLGDLNKFMKSQILPQVKKNRIETIMKGEKTAAK